MSPELAELLEAARRAARDAAATILEVYAAPFAVRRKADASPVTDADERAEAIIIAALARTAPGIPAIAEETAARRALSAAPRFWLVDPLDGTKEFVARSGEFSINIALVENERAVLGIVHVPIGAVTYAAAGPGTAMRQTGDQAPVPIAARRAPERGAVVAHSRSHANNARLGAYLAALVEPQVRVSGSAVKFCFIAEGSADFYPRFGPTMEWDTAAGQAILEAAGGAVTEFGGGPLRYAKPGFRNPEFLARGRQ